MRKYDKYKDSGIEWIGDIPEGWKIKRIKDTSKLETGNTPPKSDPKNYEGDHPWVKPDELDELNPIIETKEKLTSKGKELSRVVPKGSILVCGIGSISKMGVAGRELSTNQQINAIIPNNDYLREEYTKFLFLSDIQKEEERVSNKVVISILNKTKHGSIKIPVPKSQEQIIISNYLDEATQKLNKVIENKKKQILLVNDLYKLKINSILSENKSPENKLTPNLSWTKKLSKDYSVKKLKKCLAVPLCNGLFKKKEFFGEGTLLVNVFDIYPSILIDVSKVDRVRATGREINNYCVNENDIFLTRSSLKLDGVATCAIVNKCTEPIVFECHLIKITANSNLIEPLYLAFYLRYFSNDVLVSLSNTVTMTTISQPKINNLNIILPSVDIQKDKIVKIINIYNSKQELEKGINNQISKLEEYKKILINDVVTGKMKVAA